MSTFTTEPWIAVGAWIEVERDDIPDIASFDPAAMGQDLLPRSYEEICANAELAADAPSMLEILADVWNECRDGMPRDLRDHIREMLDAHE